MYEVFQVWFQSGSFSLLDVLILLNVPFIINTGSTFITEEKGTLSFKRSYQKLKNVINNPLTHKIVWH